MYNLKSIPKRDWWINLSPLILSLVLAVFILSFPLFLPKRLPLFYSSAWGEGQLVNSQQFLIIPLCISLITLINLAISWQLHPSQIFFKKILFFASFINSLILLITIVKIVLIFI